MHFLITNDDGIDAPGLQSLYDALLIYLTDRGYDDAELMVVAPDRGRSECGHSVTSTRDLTVRQARPGWISVDGTPVDCVRVALTCLCPDAVAVFSGVNAGANVGVDLMVSGTFAAAREAAIHGKPAMAISHYRRPDIPKTWDHVGRWIESTLDDFFAEQVSLPAGNQESGASFTQVNGFDDKFKTNRPVWNVNLPAIPPETEQTPPVVRCFVDTTSMVRRGPELRPLLQPDVDNVASDLPVNATVRLVSEFHDRPRMRGSDVEQCFAGKVTVSYVDAHVTSQDC
ncbi:5'/3'-nucleotidase SurE [Aporhodopirellula aestuarii]|uniref:5'-nucleotidase n=1 Tax=Aporhodopirellula aestuarii TaxID=2950107 RepID=A0ABT0U587_9BACT|nr:5'/3'-nucleotidase SurE [Aporhodopirellula aestuarii]MCM2372073.1 5'/3'-nucleotidase SurE [Aporhodopirellula aestuarii]